MSRDLSTAVNAALAAEHVPYVMFVYLATDNPLRITNAPYTINWSGHDWIGAGLLGSIGEVEEGSDLQMYGISLTLSGIPPEYISTALGSHYQGRACQVWLAPLNAAMQIITDPIMVFSGRLDVMSVELGQTATITVTAESRLTDWNRPKISRYTHEDQQLRYPGDKGLEFVAKTAEMELVWGRA